MKNFKGHLTILLAINIICIRVHTQLKTTVESNITHTFTIDSLGACQGVFVSGDTIFLYGDRECGIVRGYKQIGDSLQYLNCEVKLTQNGQDLINHPTGFAFYNRDTAFIGNSIRLDSAGKKWKAVIYCVNWKESLKSGKLDGHIINIIEDNACVQGTRPIMVLYKNEQYIATSDYGPSKNEIRLYDPVGLFTSKKSNNPSIVRYRFPCAPWVQNLEWQPDSNQLVLICNTTEGKGWQMNILNLPASIKDQKAVYKKKFTYPPQTELEGFAYYNGIGIAVNSSRQNNVSFIHFSDHKP